MRIILFSGFVLGDDFAYASYASQIITGFYPEVGTHGAFTGRPLLLYPIAFSILMFGWHEWSFVLPIFIASLANIIIVYTAGNLLCNALAGTLAALAIATFPLDVVLSTTLCNDILLSTLVWGGGILFLIACKDVHLPRQILLSLLSGFIVGAAVGVKINAVVAPFLFLPLAFLAFRGTLRKGSYKPLGSWILGWLLANTALCVFIFFTSGNFFAHFQAEMRFNLDHNPSGYVTAPGNLVRFLLHYPNLMLTLAREGHGEYKFPTFGYFFILFLASTPLAIFRRFREMRLPIICALFYFLALEFSPIKLYPDYVPIHRLPRFLYIVSLPAAVAIGIACARIFALSGRGVVSSVLTIGLLSYHASSLYWAGMASYFFRDTISDQRTAWEIVQHTHADIITDLEMAGYLQFRSGFSPGLHIYSPKLPPKSLPSNSLVIAGGSRRPDACTSIAADWANSIHQEKLFKIAEVPFSSKPWRLSPLKVFHTGPKLTIQNSNYKTELPDKRLIAALDVGNPASELQLGYKITEETWLGVRDFDYTDGTVCMDDGRAHKGSETMTIPGVEPHRSITILKRVDPSVRNQTMNVYFNNQQVGTWTIDDTVPVSRWEESTFDIPAELVRTSNGTLRIDYATSAHDINSFHYWFLQSID